MKRVGIPKRPPRPGTLGIIIFGVSVQLILVGKYLDNSIVSSHVPTAVDALDYANRASLWREEGFYASFDDAYRMPGYPLFLLMTSIFFSESQYLALRIFQVFGYALSGILVRDILQRFVPAKLAILGSLVFLILPNWYFTPLILAESFTTIFLVILIWFLSRISEQGLNNNQILIFAILIATLTYLKPNNLLLLFSVCTFLVLKTKKNRLGSIMLIALIVGILLAPWIRYVNIVQPGFHGLTTNSGINLYIGTGMIISYDKGALSRAAIDWGVDPKANPKDVVTLSQALSPVQLNTQFQNSAIDIWRERPLQQIGYGAEKVLISFGVKGDAPSDLTLGAFNIISIFCGLMLLMSKSFRAWGGTLLVTYLTLGIQAFVFQADRRFVIPIIVPLAVVCLFLKLSEHRSSKLFWKHTFRIKRR